MPQPEHPAQYRFAGFILDLERQELRHEGSRVELQRKVFDLIHYLVANAHRAVSREELLEQVWGGVTVGDVALARVVSLARRTLSDAGGSEEVIETVRGHGYRLAVAVEASPSATAPAAPESPHGRGARLRPARLAPALSLAAVLTAALALALPGRLPLGLDAHRPSALGQAAATRIAVLPFENMGLDGDDALLGESLADELIGELARSSGLRVASRTSSFRLAQSGLGARALARRLGVGSIVEGSVRVESTVVHLRIQLVCGRTGFSVWSRVSEHALADLSRVAAPLAAEIASQLEPGAPTPGGSSQASATSRGPFPDGAAGIRKRSAWNRRSSIGFSISGPSS